MSGVVTDDKSIMAPARDLVPVTPDDDNDLAGGICRGIAFAGAGALAVTMANGQDRTIASGVLAAGVLHPIRIKRIKAAGTTATSIFVAY